MAQNKRLGIEIKEDIEQQSNIKVHEKTITTLSEILDISGIVSIYDNCTYTSIIRNESFTYIKNDLRIKALSYTSLIANPRDIIIPYNTNNKRQPELEQIIITPLFELELKEGIIYVTKVLDNIEIL